MCFLDHLYKYESFKKEVGEGTRVALDYTIYQHFTKEVHLCTIPTSTIKGTHCTCTSSTKSTSTKYTIHLMFQNVCFDGETHEKEQTNEMKQIYNKLDGISVGTSGMIGRMELHTSCCNDIH